MGACPRCKYDHPPVSFTAWAWAVRDAKDKPPAGQVAVLLILGTRMNPATGCGWISRERLMADLGVKKETVTRATIWAMNNLLLNRLVRGHRTWDGGATDSLWVLADPSTAPTGAVEGSTAQTGAVEQPTTAQTGALDGTHNSAHLPHTRAQMGAPKEEPVEEEPINPPVAPPEEPATAANGSGPPRKRGTRVPPDFPDQLRADPKHAEWFRRECPDVDGRVQLAQFMDHWTSRAGAGATKVDWFATWRKWMRTEQEKITNRRQHSSTRPVRTDPEHEWMMNR